MDFIAGVAKLIIIVFHLCILLTASNQHGKAWRGNVNFWAVLAVVAANLVVLSVGGFFDGFLNFGV